MKANNSLSAILCSHIEVVKHTGYLPLHDFPPSIRIQLGMLSISEIYYQLLFGSSIETKIRLVREVLHMEKHFNERGLRHKCLRLLALATIHSRFFSVGYVRFSVTVHNLKILTNISRFSCFEVSIAQQIILDKSFLIRTHLFELQFVKAGESKGW